MRCDRHHRIFVKALLLLTSLWFSERLLRQLPQGILRMHCVTLLTPHLPRPCL
ncbi:Hypothetical protein, putative [Bodo saltans]|uniref:Membrane-associated protein n=1 Tax=Bodo saltans TaxID=75058 RepID=A0A0S4J5F6_BODSA|nr:Hypothetical protein, putative [Bodo saltans]|eukprot:CUG76971.1 Hypothetical protein, putative [Bodo saltans]